MPQTLPLSKDQGRSWVAKYHRAPPPSIDNIFPDPSADRELVLCLNRAVNYDLLLHKEHGPRANHWSLFWIVGTQRDPLPQGRSRTIPIVRRIEINTERVWDATHGFVSQYVYWGPRTHTSAADVTTSDGVQAVFSLGTLSAAARRRLEELAFDVPVFEFQEGLVWNCQDWVRGVLEQAVEDELLEKDVCDEAVDKAAQVVPSTKGG
ncbi:hypothetical protein OF83DRAFT_1169447 [Amylostereum chailletii]|nr:hypothetical protein OF83DRAFT_1169447 [Amylostereum chailletii]